MIQYFITEVTLFGKEGDGRDVLTFLKPPIQYNVLSTMINISQEAMAMQNSKK